MEAEFEKLYLCLPFLFLVLINFLVLFFFFLH